MTFRHGEREMARAAGLGAVILLIASAPAAWAAPTLELSGMIARVTIVPEARTDIQVVVTHADPRLPVRVRTFAGHTYLTGDAGGKAFGRSGGPGRETVSIRGLGDIAYEQLPQLVVHTPPDVRVRAGEAVFGDIGHAASVELTNRGYGDWTVADTPGRLQLNQTGSGTLRAGSGGVGDLRVEALGTILAGDVRGGLHAVSSGGGNLTVASVTGPVDARVAGAGVIDLRAGVVTVLTASIAGSGRVNFGGVADSLRATIAGSGGVTVAKVLGPVSRQVFGPGDIRVGRAPGLKHWAPRPLARGHMARG